METIKFEATMTMDAAGVYYRGNLSVRELLRVKKVATWSRDTLKRSLGAEILYDRALNETRARALAVYFLNGGGFSLDVILNCRSWEHVKVTHIENTTATYLIEIPLGVFLYVVDGQHRVAGKELAGGKHLDDQIPIRVCQYEEAREAMEFFFINHEGQRVPPDLHALIAHQIFHSDAGRKYRESDPAMVEKMRPIADAVHIFIQARNVPCQDGNPVEQILRLPDQTDHNDAYRSVSVSSMRKLTEQISRMGAIPDIIGDGEKPAVVVNVLRAIRATWPEAWRLSLKRWEAKKPHANLVIEKSLTPIIQCIDLVIREVPTRDLRNVILDPAALQRIVLEIARSLDMRAVADVTDIQPDLITENNDHFWISRNQLLNNLRSSNIRDAFANHLETIGGISGLIGEISS